MNGFAHILDKLEPLLLAIFVPIALLGWAYGFLAKVGKRQRLKSWEPEDSDTRFVLGIGIFGLVLLGVFAVGGFVNREALEEINSKLSRKIEKVNVNGKPFSEGEALANALRGMSDTGAHHSSPEQSFEVNLTTDRGPLYLLLRRDSQNPHEYRVYYDRFRSTQTRDVARVSTDLLDKIE